MGTAGGFWVRGKAFVDDRQRVGLEGASPYPLARVREAYEEFAELGRWGAADSLRPLPEAAVEAVLGFCNRWGLVGLLPARLICWVDREPGSHGVRLAWYPSGGVWAGVDAEGQEPGAVLAGWPVGAGARRVPWDSLRGWFDGEPVRPGHQDFWTRYREPVRQVVWAASWWRSLMEGLARPRRSPVRREAEAALAGLLGSTCFELFKGRLVVAGQSLLGHFAVALARDAFGAHPARVCAVCGKVFTSRRRQAEYCSTRCRWVGQKRRQRSRP